MKYKKHVSYVRYGIVIYFIIYVLRCIICDKKILVYYFLYSRLYKKYVYSDNYLTKEFILE